MFAKVEQNDTATKSRTQLYHYTEYESAFEEIKKQIGQHSVYTGEFEETWNEIEAELKRLGIDNLFLAQINKWRIILGREIYAHKSDLSIEESNEIELADGIWKKLSNRRLNRGKK